ncbi:TRAP transporter substrate-binding protein [Metabacillus litoralis]|uniref:TRAP transporter substrate-binding protein n=1 Tax=Metabacillus TaxID=2675233 RepID=UPI001B94349E|nr:TRAP transporter substrate-binding protein [Metabacillus litoralis]MCM3159879.1 TRAP transporter substrate-binding protein [Metabacillus litoralis]MCM3408459.1 TRAP transporter substrate-binding protein [Metabacillus litoralis]UHA59872.1 TRAP transporter substrate-binding protein [Metabacillus litoralis]
MKKLGTLLSVIGLTSSILLAGCGAESSNGGSADEPKILKLAEIQPEDYPTTVGAKEFAKLVEEKTDGRYKVEVYAGGQLGDEKSAIEQVQLGSIDVARVNAGPLTEFSDDIGVLALPYIFRDEIHQWDVLNGEVGKELLKTLEPSNMIGLSFYDSGKRSFYNSKKPIETPEDLEGLKIRVQQSDMVIDMVKALGASATPMAFEEVYSGIQTGVIDGAENNFPSYYSTNHFEVAKYYTLDGHSTTPELLVMSKSTWDQLSDGDKKAFEEAAMESVDVQRKAWDELEEKARTDIEANGNEIIEIEDTTPWREKVQPVYDKYGEQYSDWIEKINNL